MPNDWANCTWGDLATLEYGKALRSYREGSGEYPVYGTNGPIGWHSEYLCPHPGVIVGRKGAYRGIHYCDQPFYVIDTAFYLRPKRDISLKWAYYELLTHDINSMDSGSAIPSTSREAFYQLPVLLPTLREQEAIAEVLGALDDKIELNRQTNQTLEALAQRLFKSWFVDFDPVKAKLAGRTPAHMDAETAALFPDRLVESKLGLIPEGWTPATIGNLVKLHYGKALKASERIQGEVPVYGSSGQVGKHDAALVDGPGIVVGRKGQPGLVHYSAGAFFPIDTTFYVEPLIKESWLYTYHALLAADLASWATDSAVPGLNRKIAYDVPWLRSDPGLIKAYEDTVNPLKERQNQLDAETQTLCELRDRLLPKLISGQLRVRDAERHVAEVV